MIREEVGGIRHFIWDEGEPNACGAPIQAGSSLWSNGANTVTCKACRETDLFARAYADDITRVLAAQGYVPRTQGWIG